MISCKTQYFMSIIGDFIMIFAFLYSRNYNYFVAIAVGYKMHRGMFEYILKKKMQANICFDYVKEYIRFVHRFV